VEKNSSRKYETFKNIRSRWLIPHVRMTKDQAAILIEERQDKRKVNDFLRSKIAKWLIRKMSIEFMNTNRRLHLEKEDVKSISRVALHRAIMNYEPLKGDFMIYAMKMCSSYLTMTFTPRQKNDKQKELPINDLILECPKSREAFVHQKILVSQIFMKISKESRDILFNRFYYCTDILSTAETMNLTRYEFDKRYNIAIEEARRALNENRNIS